MDLFSSIRSNFFTTSCLLALCVSGCGLDAQSDLPSGEATLGSSAAALTSGQAAFVWSSSAFGSFDGPSSYSWNSAGGTNHITWLSTGFYQVDFPGISLSGGNVQVTAYGSSSQYCKVSSWGGSSAFVRCFDSAGNPTSTLFTASYQSRTDNPGVEGGYVWANEPSTTDYTPSPSYQWNSAGGSITIHRLEPGLYSVNFPGQTPFSPGTLEVTAYGSDNALCVARGGTDAILMVGCRSPSGGAVDSQFSAVLSKASPNNTNSYTFALANAADASLNVPTVTAVNWQHGALGTHCGGETPTTGQVTQTRTATGRYTVNFPQMVLTAGVRSNVKVTSSGALGGYSHCNVVGWGSTSGGAKADVACFQGSVPVNESFFITFSSTQIGGC